MKDMDTTDNSLTYYGGAVKALGGGKFSGYLLLFTDASSPDLQGEFFTKSTDLFINNGDQRPVLYRHGVHPVIKSRKLGRATLTVDDVGVFMEGELSLSDNYEKAIYKMVEKGRMGLSSGSMGHLVSKTPREKSFEITAWPIGEASITPNPVEPRTRSLSIKDLGEDELDLDAFIKAQEDEEYSEHFSLDGTPSIKAFCEAVAPASLLNGTQRSELAAHANKEFITIGQIMGEAHDSNAARLVKRTEHRFLKEGRDIDVSTIAQTTQQISEMKAMQIAIQGVIDSLEGICKLSEISQDEKKAMDAKARLAVWNYHRISGTTPTEESNNG